MGAKLFAWLGGIAAFLGAAFFVKYSFEHDLISPEVRVALGFLFGLTLIVGGLRIPRERYAITAQTLIATGVVTLYAVTFACHSVYHFAFFGLFATFLVMTGITAAAFLLAVRLEARVIAVIGMLAGFLTPVLLSTGKDNPGALFGYLALLDAGLIAVALHRRWWFLVPLAATGTLLMQIGWAVKFLNAAKAPVAMSVTLGFSALFFLAYLVARRTRRASRELTWSAVAMPFVALGFAAAFLAYPSVAARVPLWFGFVVLADAVLLTVAWLDDEMPKLHLIAGFAVFMLLVAWTVDSLSPSVLRGALAMYLVFALLHSAFPFVLERHRPAAAPTWWSQLFPPLTLLLMVGPLLRLDVVSFALWPSIFVIDLLAIALALFTASLGAVVVVLVLTLGATALWIFKLPATEAPPDQFLIVLGGFVVVFFAASVFLARRFGYEDKDRSPGLASLFGDTRTQLPAFSALLPFVLLILATQRLAFTDPTPVFGLALLLIMLTLSVSAIMRLEWLPACALMGTSALEYSWHLRYGDSVSPGIPLFWYLGFAAVFGVYPFALRRRFSELTGPWAASALGWVFAFPLAYWLVKRGWPNDMMGLLPAAFAVPALVSLMIVRGVRTNERARLNQLAWFGGVALLFITLIVPIQFERQWLTVGWALEGAALLWLFHRVPHGGLRAVGAALLVVAFVRLALNPAVLEYHPRSGTALLNWYLYAYGVVTVALFVGARLLAAPRNLVLGINTPPLLNTLGTLLAFLLLNIEIADFFSSEGTPVLTFAFSGNFARDMTYTIAWSLFALGLLLVSIWKQLRPGRYAALALLGVAALKLFVHDLARLHSLYRIGALFGVAIVAIIASVAYQRFLPSDEKDRRGS